MRTHWLCFDAIKLSIPILINNASWDLILTLLDLCIWCQANNQSLSFYLDDKNRGWLLRAEQRSSKKLCYCNSEGFKTTEFLKIGKCENSFSISFSNPSSPWTSTFEVTGPISRKCLSSTSWVLAKVQLDSQWVVLFEASLASSKCAIVSQIPTSLSENEKKL